MNLVKYGSASFDPAQFDAIRDDHWIKPKGGLWASPVDSEFGWVDWCSHEEFTLDRASWFKFTYEGNIVVIDTEGDLNLLDWGEDYGCGLGNINFEAMLARGIDAIHLTVRGQERTRFSRPRSLYGWDCESVLIMNPSPIRQYAASGMTRRFDLSL